MICLITYQKSRKKNVFVSDIETITVYILPLFAMVIWKHPFKALSVLVPVSPLVLCKIENNDLSDFQLLLCSLCDKSNY